MTKVFELDPAPFTATLAKSMAEDAKSLHGTYLRKETDEILAKIRISATRGDMLLITSILINEVVRKRLESLGFKVKVSTERNEDFTTISWG